MAAISLQGASRVRMRHRTVATKLNRFPQMVAMRTSLPGQKRFDPSRANLSLSASRAADVPTREQAMAKVRLNNVSQSASGIRDLSLEIPDRELVVLAGPSGCGKSTLLRLIAGLENISRGEIFIGERRVNDVPAKDRDIGVVFADGALYPHLRVYENLAFGLKRRKFSKSEIQKRVADAAAVLGIGEFLEHKPRALSVDARQRVAIARAIVRQPKVLLFEEPSFPLDGKMRREIRKLHERLQTTLIYVTSDPVEAMSMGDRIAVMNGGVLQQADTPSNLYHEPMNQFVAGFLGRPPMNFLHGTLKSDPDSVVFTELDGGTVAARFPIADRPGLREFIGQPVVLGIRPEDIVPMPSETGGAKSGTRFRAIVESVEPMGGKTTIDLQTGAHMIVCQTQLTLDHRDAGQRMQFAIEVANAHLFDPVSTQRLV